MTETNFFKIEAGAKYTKINFEKYKIDPSFGQRSNVCSTVLMLIK